MADAPLPIACILESEKQGERFQEVTHILSAAHEVTELGDGYRFEFPNTDDAILKIAGFMTEERRCCPFFVFDLHCEGLTPSIYLSLRGPLGTKQFIESQMLSQSAREAR